MFKTTNLWWRASLWLLVLGPGFFLVYGSVNHFTAAREPVASLFLSFERSIPVVPWHILPYMLLDVMFAMSLFMCRSIVELDQHAKRLASAIGMASICFLLWPLKFGFERPELNGFWGVLHKQLTEFDLPYNQAPSLHIILLVIVGVVFLRHVPNWLKLPTLLWCGIIFVSVLTTHQHHSIDIVTAIPVTFFCLCLFPNNAETKLEFSKVRAHDDSHWVAYLYLALTIGCFIIGGLLGYWGMLLVLPGMACALMAAAYLWRDERLLHKNQDGSVPWYVKCVMFPVVWVQTAYKITYTSDVNAIDEVIDGVFIARRLNNSEFDQQVHLNKIKTFIDVAPEFTAPSLPTDVAYIAFNWLDLAPVRIHQLNIAADALAQSLNNGNVLIECKLGLQRSVLVLIAYLVKYQQMTIKQAYATVLEKREGAVLRQRQTKLLEEFKQTCIQ